MRGAGHALGAWLVVLLCVPQTVDARRHHGESSKRAHKKSDRKRDKKGDISGSSAVAGQSAANSADTVRKPRAVALLLEAKAALEAGDLDGAHKKADAAYRKQASAQGLFVLGQVAQAQGRVVEAHDLFRRYLADPSASSDAVLRAEAQRQAGLSLPQAGDLYIAGDKDALVYVNDRLLGSLPLLLPLRVAAGNLSVTLQSGGRSSKGTVEVPAGQAREMRFDELTGAVLVSVPPTVVLVEERSGKLSSEAALVEALEKGSQLVGYSLAASERKLGFCESLSADCLLDLAKQRAANYALGVREVPSSSGVSTGKELQLQLWDVQVGDLAAQETVRCSSYRNESDLAAVTEQVATVLRRGRARPRGMLSVSSIPSEAQLALSGRFVGKTPWKGSVFVGPQQVELWAHGFERQQLSTTVQPGQTAMLSTLLSPELLNEPLPYGERRSVAALGARPLWRVATGAAMIGVGMLLTGIGGSALAANGTCVPPLQPPALVCRETIQSGPLGGSLLGIGLGLSIGGVVMVAIPPRGSSSP